MYTKSHNIATKSNTNWTGIVYVVILFILPMFIAIFEKNLSIAMVNLVFLSTSFIILKSMFKNDSRRIINIYYIACFINIIYLIFFSYYNELLYNSVYIVFDEIGFMERSILRLNNLKYSNSIPVYSNAAGYETILSWIHYFSNIFGDTHVMNARLLSIYSSGFIPVVLYKYLKENTEFKNIDTIIKTFVFFPIFNYFSIVALRDIFAATIIIGIFYIVSKEKLKIISVSVMFFLLWLLSTIRFEQFSFMVIAIVVLQFSKSVNSKHSVKVGVRVILIIGSVAYLFYAGGTTISGAIQRYYDLVTAYGDRAQNIYQDNSLGVALRRLPFPMNVVSVFVFGFIGGFPPWSGYSIMAPQYSFLRFIQGIGNFMWLFSLPYLLIGWKYLKENSKIKFSNAYKYSLYLSIAFIFFVTTVSNDMRRFLPALFILYTFNLGISGIKNNSKKSIFLIVYGALLSLTILYIAIKII